MHRASPASPSHRPIFDAPGQPWRGILRRGTRTAPRQQLLPGQGQAALVFPRYGAGPESTLRLRGALDGAGFRSFDWGYGTDTGPRSGSLRNRLRYLEEKVIDLFEAERQPLTLIGWGFSGLYARELAKRVTPLVRQVITLGTPFNAGAGECAMLRPLHDQSGRVPEALQRQLRERPPVPCTSIYTMGDGAVPWQMCVAPESPGSETILVPVASHRQLADHALVREIIADRLAQPGGDWAPFAG
ncbi:alpha/beta hydrolase [Ramlibacter sp.]|uniref:alpha/beta hydrolase n=1 Tax=Ramlibacter sp. TaxID=1917967 RepID=UPI002B8DB12A|nr:alpha/beta hydrolase [Ramlibacter sp.]HWI81707.1 alpha/beta hydrolase [Ramlibacter sp.]